MVAFIAKTYGNTYTTLLPRVTKTLAKAIASEADSVKPMTTHYGAIVGLTLLGPNVIDSVLFPMLEGYMKALPQLEGTTLDREKVKEALQNAAEQWRQHFGSDADKSKLILLKTIFK